jgi:dTDP-4-amino-4,6-dideoxygalactose transaminase
VKAKRFSRQGLVRTPSDFKIIDQGPWHQEVHEFGLNYRLPDVLCALGISQVKRIQDFKNKKKIIYQSYLEYFREADWVATPPQRAGVDVNWHLFPIRVDPLKRTEIFTALRKKGIGVQVNYIPAYWHPVFNEMGFRRGMYPNSDLFYSQEISLPMYSELGLNEVELIARSLITKN